MTLHWPTLVFQAVNFLVLLALLSRLMFRPLLRHMKDRRASIEASLASIEAARAEIASARSELEAAEAERAEARAAILADARREAERARAEVLATARAEAEAERERRLAQVELERTRAREALIRDLPPLVARVTERLLTEIAPSVRLHEAACARLASHLATLEPSPGPLEVESATGELTAELEAAVARLAAEGRARAVRRTPDLIAGARIHLGDRVLDGSVQAQIERALEGAT